MKIKPNWIKYLHGLRKEEFNIIFKRFPKTKFEKGLEVGAGDGYQTTLLQEYVKQIISSNYNIKQISKIKSKQIKYMECDAEQIDTYFKKDEFDIIFSSNLIEHLKNPNQFLNGIHKILKNDGITIHCIPNSFWKITQIIFHYINLIVVLFERITNNSINKSQKKQFDNNPKITTKRSKLIRLLFPLPHGAYDSNYKELILFRKNRWIKEFNDADFNIIAILKGPVASGYGLGFTKIKTFLEKYGICSEYIFVAIKKNRPNPYKEYF
ncbi:MAG: class I SAM-dependent methyltransferase [DPANN group archaeon]|nr:class I SAM-dependent methyltransferase [DPANN group archaeon]